MAPRRSTPRRSNSNSSPPAYKKGQFIEYKYNGNTVTGKLYKKSPNSTDTNPLWIVTPMDRRRRNEDISEKSLGKVITEAEAMTNRGPKLKPTSGKEGASTELAAASPSSSSSKNSNSDEDEMNYEDQEPKRRSGRTTPSSGSNSGGKRKSSYDNDSNNNDNNEANAQNKKGVTFSQQESSSTTAANKKNIPESRKIGTRRRTGGTTEMVLLPDIPKKKGSSNSGGFSTKMKKIKKDENVTVVKMLTGNLYLYRGDKPRAEFIRSK